MWWVAALGAACWGGALPLHAASSQQTVGVLIVIPEREDLAAGAEADGASPDPLVNEPGQRPVGFGLVRTVTTVAGEDGRRLVTDVPEL